MRCSSFFDVRFEDVDVFFVYQTAMCFVAGELKARMLSRPKSGNVFLREREDVLVLQQQKGVSNNGSVNCVCHILFIV